jgi:hypothetical protein
MLDVLDVRLLLLRELLEGEVLVEDEGDDVEQDLLLFLVTFGMPMFASSLGRLAEKETSSSDGLLSVKSLSSSSSAE